MITSLPLELGPDLPFQIEGRPEHWGAQWRYSTPHYFRAMRIPLRQGRWFSETDTAQSSAVVIINEALAWRYFRGRSPLGQQITIGRYMGPAFADRTREIVGVVGDVREEGLARPAPPTVFLPATQVPDVIYTTLHRVAPTNWVVRTTVEPMSLAATVQREVLAVGRSQPVANLRSMEQVLGGSISRQRFNMLLLGVFAGLALALAMVGIYGVMS